MRELTCKIGLGKNRVALLLSVVLLPSSFCHWAQGQNYSVNWYLIGGGGGVSFGGGYASSSTIGQPAASGALSGGNYSSTSPSFGPPLPSTSAPIQTSVLTWANPANIVYGTPLSAAQLYAAADVLGTYAYSPTNGTVLYAGTNTLSVVFTPADTAGFSSATKSVTLVVSPAPLTVTAANASRFPGAPNPVLAGAITGLVNGDNFTAAYSCSATSSSPLGTYPIVPSLVPNNLETNYTVSLVNGTLTVGELLYANTAPNKAGEEGYLNNPLEFGNQITLAGPSTSDLITSFSCYISYGGVSNATAELRFYSNNGPQIYVTNGNVITGYPAPGLLLFDSGFVPIGIIGTNVTFNLASLVGGVVVPQNFTWTIDISNTTSILGGYGPPNVGSYNGGWENSSIGWLFFPPANSLEFGAIASGTSEFIIWTNPAPILYGAGLTTNQLNATANVAGSLAFSLPLGTVLNAGSHSLSVVFTPSDTTDYISITNSVTLVVSPAPLTVTAANTNRSYGATNPTFTGVITGLQNGDNISATYSCVATTTSAVGSYPIVPVVTSSAGVLANYSLIPVGGALTVTGAPLTVNIANASRVYGAANPSFSGSISGLLNSDNITATYNTAATVWTGVGTYAIVPDFIDPVGKLGNYTVSTNGGILAITPAPLTITADNVWRVYDIPNPSLSGAITGLLNGDNITLAFTTTATTISPLGTYPIVPNLVDPNHLETNYLVTTNNGTLTIEIQVTPILGPASGRTAVTILGTGFQSGASVWFGSNAASSVVVNNSTNITALTPAAAGAGWVNVVVTNADGSSDVLSNGFAYADSYVATVLSFNPVAYWRLNETNSSQPALNIGSLGAAANGVYVADAQPGVAGVPDSGFGPTNYACQFNGTNGHIDIPGSPTNLDLINGPRSLMAWVLPIGSSDGLIFGENTFDLGVANNRAYFFGLVSSFGTIGYIELKSSETINDGKWHQLVGVYDGLNYYLFVDGQLEDSLVGTPDYPVSPVANDTNFDLWIGDNSAGAGSSVFDGAVDEVAIFTNALSATAVQQIYQAASSVPSVLPSFVNWLYPTPIIYGQQLGLGQLNATSLAPGTFAYDPTLAAGSNTLYLTFNPYDAADFSGETTNVPILVLPAPLTVTANDATNSYGAANPVLTGSISGLVNGDNITAAFSSGTGPGSQIGAYPIVPALLDPANRLDNYNVTTNLGVLTITPVPLTVTAYNATQIYGAASPAFTGSISGLVNNDYIAPIFSSAASAGSQPGSYPIAPTLLDPDNRLVNYVVTTNFGVFTIISTNPPPFSQAYSQGPLLITTLTGLLPGELVVVQSSTDLSTWTTIQTNTATGANLSITNLINPSGVMQFFRAAVQ